MMRLPLTRPRALPNSLSPQLRTCPPPSPCCAAPPGLSCPATLFRAKLPADLSACLQRTTAELASHPQQLNLLFQGEPPPRLAALNPPLHPEP